MNRNRSIAFAAVVAFAALMLTPAVFAAQPKYDQNGENAHVIAHVPLNGPAATRMFTQYHNGHRYLYVDQGSENQVTVIDVSHPSRPVVVQTTSWPDNAAQADLSFMGSDIAISQAQPVTATPSTVRILDVVDAGHPAVLRTFNGVTSILPDRARNLVYLANNDGLWIVRHRISQSGWASRHMCTSEDAINPVPDCY